MNVHLYVGIVIALGFVSSYFLGRVPSTLRLIAAAAAFAVASIALGLLLSFPLLQVTARLCEALGYSLAKCVVTDDRTVWALAFPLEAFPLYFVIMIYANRAKGASKQNI